MFLDRIDVSKSSGPEKTHGRLLQCLAKEITPAVTLYLYSIISKTLTIIQSNNFGVSPITASLRPPRRIVAVRRNPSSASGSSKNKHAGPLYYYGFTHKKEAWTDGADFVS